MKSKSKLSAITKNEMFTLLMTLVILCLIMSILSPKFFVGSNLMNIVRQSSQYGIIAIGMTLVVLLGGIDLSVGSVQAMSGIAAVWVLNYFYGSPAAIPLAIITGILVGALIGTVNALIIVKLNIQPLICTLGTMAIVRGLAEIVTNAVSIQAKDPNYMKLGMGRWLGVPIPVWILVVLTVIFYFILNYTIFGRYVYSIGGNKAASHLVGIPVDKVTSISYIVNGALAGLAAVILSARLGSGQAMAGNGFEMTVIAAVIIGGVSLNGGRGNLIGAIIGVIILYVLTNGLILLQVSSFWQDVIRGALIIFAVYIDNIRSANVAKQLLRAGFEQGEMDKPRESK